MIELLIASEQTAPPHISLLTRDTATIEFID